jgi:hypothetical protein
VRWSGRSQSEALECNVRSTEDASQSFCGESLLTRRAPRSPLPHGQSAPILCAPATLVHFFPDGGATGGPGGWNTFRLRPPNATSAANIGFDQPSMIALASSRIPELGAVVEVLPTIRELIGSSPALTCL